MLTRRQFLKICTAGMATASLSKYLLPHITEAAAYLGERPPAIWLELHTCTGNFLSFLNTLDPDHEKIIKEMIDLRYSNAQMAAEGKLALNALYEVPEKYPGEYILIVEGTVATKAKGLYGVIGFWPDGTPITQLEAVKHFASKAKYIIAAGTCASFGGPFAASPNPSDSRAVHQVVSEQVINTPGCPVHPDWIVGTLTHLLLYGMPELDADNRPTAFYGSLIHDNCPRRHDFNQGHFAEHPGDSGCTYQIGCKGPVTFADCPTRLWSSAHNNWPVGANTPCIGCVDPGFPDQMSPFFAHLPNINVPGTAVNVQTFAMLAGGATLAGIGGHLLYSIAKGRVQKNLVQGTQTSHLGEDKVFEPESQKLIDDLQQTVSKLNQFQQKLDNQVLKLETQKSRSLFSFLTSKVRKKGKLKE
ncbi:MAG: hydrogenase small subunit [Bacillota bacterium]